MDKRQKVNNKGFTLVELLIVIVIIGILAAVAIPKFSKAQYKAIVSEFPTVLTQIYTAEGAFEAELNVYLACEDDDDFDSLGVSIPPSNTFDYSVELTAGPPPGFNASASSTKTIGVVESGTEASINQDGIKTANEFIVYAPTWYSPE